jgi:hypothetical protein
LACSRCGVRPAERSIAVAWLPNRDHNASVERFGDLVAGRHKQVELATTRNGDRVALYAIANEPVA